MKTVTLEEAAQAISYDPKTGEFTRIGRFPGSPRKARSDLVGKTTGNLTVRGYVDITLGRRVYQAHRLAFLFMTGEMPEFVDHKDGDGTNNRWDNLRPCSKSQNMANRGPSVKSTSGIKGVYPHKPSGRWRVQIVVEDKIIHLGYFADMYRAAEVYNAAAIQYFGEFAKELQKVVDTCDTRDYSSGCKTEGCANRTDQ